jgi:hypothetical protein
VSCGRGCYEIGGPWITCDPECPEHGDEARQRGSRLAELEAENERLKARLVDYDKLVLAYDELIDKSRKWYHDSTQWEGAGTGDQRFIILSVESKHREIWMCRALDLQRGCETEVGIRKRDRYNGWRLVELEPPF